MTVARQLTPIGRLIGDVQVSIEKRADVQISASAPNTILSGDVIGIKSHRRAVFLRFCLNRAVSSACCLRRPKDRDFSLLAQISAKWRTVCSSNDLKVLTHNARGLPARCREIAQVLCARVRRWFGTLDKICGQGLSGARSAFGPAICLFQPQCRKDVFCLIFAENNASFSSQLHIDAK